MQPYLQLPPSKTKRIEPILSLLFIVVFALFMGTLMFLLSPQRASQNKITNLHLDSQLRIGVLDNRTGTSSPYRAKGIEIIEEIAKRYHWEITYTAYSSTTKMVDALLDKQVDILADMVIDHQSAYPVHFSQSYTQATPIIAHFPEISPVRNTFQELFTNRLLVIDKSWQDRLLEREKLIYPQLLWQELPRYFTLDELVQSIASPPGGYTLLLASEFQRMHFRFNKLQFLFELEAIDLGFALRKEDAQLEKFISDLIGTMQLPSTSELPMSKRPPELSRASLKTFLGFVETRLPQFIHLFLEAGQTHQLDWRLIAAIAYQESLWNADAVSPTGVRGLMMLTAKTASALGVKDRTDPRESVFGGTQYFLFLRDRIPQRINEPDRSWFALAAYNVGFAHVQDVRRYVESIGGNKDSWHDVSAQLHLLEEPTWYSNSRYGYARGREARLYVDNIRKYLEVMLFVFDSSKNIDAQLTKKQNNTQMSVLQTNKPELIIPQRINPRY